VKGNTLFSSVDVSGIIQVKNTTQSTTTSNGALIVTGGVGIMKNLNVGGDTVISGNLTAGAFATDNMSVNNITTGILLANTRISTSNIYIGNSTIANLVGTTISASTLNLSTGVTSGVVFATSGSFTTIGTSWLNATTISGGNISLSGDLFVAGTVTTVNITSTNIVNTNVSAGVVLASTLLSAPGNSNTIGSIFTTGGNVGINNANPSYTLDVTGELKVSNSITTGTLLANTSITVGALFVTGGSLLQGAFTVSGASVLNAGATAGALFVTGGSLLQGDITVSGASVFNAGVTSGALFVTGGSLLKGSVTVSGASVFNAGVTTGALFVTGGTLIKGDLGVTGASLFVGNVTMGSNVIVGGPAFKIPTGDIAARPGAPEAGYVRYNSETQQFEGYGPGSAWGSLGGVIDIAQTTKILASETPSTTDGNLYFITVNSERMRINSAGNIGIGTSAPNYKLDVVGTLRASIGITTGSICVTGATLLQSNVTATGGSYTFGSTDIKPILNGTSATGGAIIFNTVDVSPSMGDISRERYFQAQNNVTSASVITGFAFNNSVVRAFDAVVSVTILDEGSNKYAYYNLKGVQKSSNWVLNSSYVGDVTGFTFSIDNSGQIKYTSTNVPGYLSSYVNFRALTTTVNP